MKSAWIPALASALAATAVAAPPAGPAAGPTAGPRHVVVIVADDLGFGDVGYHGGRSATPHLDALADQALRLERFYVSPVGSAARYALLTGRAPERAGLARRALRPWSSRGLRAEEVTAAEVFRAAGYQTVAIGKWHLGHARPEHHPNAQGFGHFYGLLTARTDYFTHRHEGALDWQRNGKSLEEKGYATHLLAREAVQRIRGRDPERPLFLYLAFNAPHAPYQATKKWLLQNAAIHNRQQETYAAMLSALDWAVGEVLAALEAEGLADETIVAFTSDNGAPRDAGSNRPLRDYKGSTFEGGIRVPALLRAPNALPAGAATSQPMRDFDLLPTLAAAVGAALPEALEVDGLDLWRELRAGEIVAREPFFFACDRPRAAYSAVLQDGHKLVHQRLRSRGETRRLLFDLDADPAEERDLAAARPAVVQRLAAALAAWEGRYGAEGDEPGGKPAGWEPPDDWARLAPPP